MAKDVGAPGVHSLDRFTLAVPDLDQAESFYRSFGLAVERQEATLLLRTFGSPHIWAEIIQGADKKLLGLRFGIYAADIPRFADRLRHAGQLDDRHAIDGLSLHSPDGLRIELAVAAKSSPDAKTELTHAARHDDIRGAAPRSGVTPVRPTRLAHVALFTRDVSEAVDFFTDTLGLRLSDRSEDDVAFMHGIHGSDHHMIALARSDGPGLHHCSWDVPTVAHIGSGAAQMADAGYARGWGLGRHILGSNYFHYVRDPWGSYAEYSADMDYVPAGSDWPSGNHPGVDSFYQWGPPPPDDFVTNYEAAHR
jgi:catechol 2,3-dioxygenase-like lactoylglutathione lyase family enzyme